MSTLFLVVIVLSLLLYIGTSALAAGLYRAFAPAERPAGMWLRVVGQTTLLGIWAVILFLTLVKVPASLSTDIILVLLFALDVPGIGFLAFYWRNR